MTTRLLLAFEEWEGNSLLRIRVELRYWARRLGILRLYQALRREQNAPEEYERHYRAAALRTLRPGDVVWDIGANVGIYTNAFAHTVGEDGTVVAFEPAPACFEHLQAEVGHLANVVALQVALSNRSEMLPMSIATDPLGVTHSLAEVSESAERKTVVRVEAGDSAIDIFRLPIPNVIKIDVEGYELEVLEGLDATLSSPDCRAVLCEVHFGLLASRGMRRAPVSILGLLRDRGFDVEWTDQSHIVATKKTPLGVRVPPSGPPS